MSRLVIVDKLENRDSTLNCTLYFGTLSKLIGLLPKIFKVVYACLAFTITGKLTSRKNLQDNRKIISPHVYSGKTYRASDPCG